MIKYIFKINFKFSSIFLETAFFSVISFLYAKNKIWHLYNFLKIHLVTLYYTVDYMVNLNLNLTDPLNSRQEYRPTLSCTCSRQEYRPTLSYTCSVLTLMPRPYFLHYQVALFLKKC